MKRRSLNLLAVASLTTSLLLAIVFAYSFWRTDALYYVSADRRNLWMVNHAAGTFGLQHVQIVANGLVADTPGLHLRHEPLQGWSFSDNFYFVRFTHGNIYAMPSALSGAGSTIE